MLLNGVQSTMERINVQRIFNVIPSNRLGLVGETILASGDRDSEEMRRRFYGHKFYRRKNVWLETGRRDEINHFTFSPGAPHINMAALPVPPARVPQCNFPSIFDYRLLAMISAHFHFTI